MAKKPKLHMIRPAKLTEAQETLRGAFEVFSTPELQGFVVVAWDKDGETFPCLFSPDKTLDQVIETVRLEIQTVHTLAKLASDGIIRDAEGDDTP